MQTSPAWNNARAQLAALQRGVYPTSKPPTPGEESLADHLLSVEAAELQRNKRLKAQIADLQARGKSPPRDEAEGAAAAHAASLKAMQEMFIKQQEMLDRILKATPSLSPPPSLSPANQPQSPPPLAPLSPLNSSELGCDSQAMLESLRADLRSALREKRRAVAERDELRRTLTTEISRLQHLREVEREEAAREIRRLTAQVEALQSRGPPSPRIELNDFHSEVESRMRNLTELVERQARDSSEKQEAMERKLSQLEQENSQYRAAARGVSPPRGVAAEVQALRDEVAALKEELAAKSRQVDTHRHREEHFSKRLQQLSASRKYTPHRSSR